MWYDCALGLICDRSLDTPTCTRRHGQGEPCGYHDMCADGLVCDGGTFDPETKVPIIVGKCVPPIQAGGACTPPYPEAKTTSACVNFADCDPVSKTCVLNRALGGQECGTDTTPGACVFANVCDNTTHRCVYERAIGESCTADGAACVYPAECSASGTCALSCGE